MQDEIYDETLKTVKDGIDLVKKASNEIEDIKRRHRENSKEKAAEKQHKAEQKQKKQALKAEKKKVPEMLEKTKDDFIFTGQYTDLRYFEDAKTMPVSLIEKIPDADLKHCVKDEFNKSIADGLVNLEKGKLTITDKGRKFISTSRFQKTAASDLQRAAQVTEQKMGVELNGTMQDLGYFKFNDSLNLTDIMLSGDYETVSKITDNFKKMEEGGLVEIEKGFVNLTDKGKEMLNNPAFEGITEKAVGSVASANGSIMAATRKIIASVAPSVKGKGR